MSSLDMDKLNSLRDKVRDYLHQGLEGKTAVENEEQTKHWLILPFLEALGYDVHSSDVVPEVTADFSKKGEKVDYELQVDNQPVAIIECKVFMEDLGKHINQLYRYFPTLGIHIGILTNGESYWFFTDSTKENIMDKKPFLKFSLGVGEDLSILEDYTRENIMHAPVPSVENKRKQAEKERQLLEEQKEQELNQYKDQVGNLKSQITDMQAVIEKSKANEAIVEQMESVLDNLQIELDKANEKWQNAEKELEQLKNKEPEPTVDEEAYNAMIISQKIENDRLKQELKATKKTEKKKVFYGNSDLDKQRVPDDIAKDMIDLLPESLFVPETKILDPFCRYGELLIAFKNRAMQEPAMIKAFPDEDDRDDYISDNMLYALVIDEMGLKNVTRVIHKTSNPKECHVVCFGNEEVYKTAMRSNSKIFIKEKLEELKLMKINAVIGNPPYNNDMYIPFVEMGHQLATDCSLFITPAKWQAKGGEKNEAFRQNIVPYMKDIIYFIETKEVFDIGEPDGISVYSIDKYKHINKRIRLRCDANSVFDTEPEEIDCSKGVRMLSSKIASIVDKCSAEGTIENKLSFTRQVYCNESEKGHPIKSDEYNIGLYQGADNIDGCAKLSGWLSKDELKTTRNLERYKCIQSIKTVRGSSKAFGTDGKTIGGNLITILEPYQVPKGTFQELMTFETKLGAESFKSFIMSKLCSFLEFIGVCGHTENTEFYRFVPDPVKFDHIFTDEELYKKYNLTEEEINIIESVIKERK